MSKVINPFDLSIYSINDLIRDKLIVPSNGLKAWSASIFPESLKDNISTLLYDKDHIITFINDDLYLDHNITILPKLNNTIFINNNTGKKVIKCKEFGTYDDSVKRFTNLEFPVSYNKDNNIANFLNLPKPTDAILNNIILDNLTFNPGVEFNSNNKKSREEKLFGQELKHPHINTPKITGNFKNNNKAIIKAVFEWANLKGIKYIYSIKENRPNVISDNYVTNLVYYTIIGSL